MSKSKSVINMVALLVATVAAILSSVPAEGHRATMTAFARVTVPEERPMRRHCPITLRPPAEYASLFGTALAAVPSPTASVISPADNWGNVAVLSLAASLAQVLGRSTAPGKLLGAPVVAMALTFVLSSVGWFPGSRRTLLPSGGSPASAFLQGTTLTLATPLLLLGTSLRGDALGRCGALLGSFAVASLGTLAGAVLAFSSNIRQAMVTALPHGDGAKIAAALLAKNIGGGINYMAVCACLRAAPESIAAGLCVDNVMALVYFPLVSVLASRHEDVQAGGEHDEPGAANGGPSPSIDIEALSNAFALAAVLTAVGRSLNSRLCRVPALLGGNAEGGAGPLDLSLPLTTLLAVLFSAYYPPDVFLSPMSSNNGKTRSNNIAAAGETLGTACLYLFFSTAGALGWRMKESIQRSFPAIASFLMVLYSVHGAVLWGSKKLVEHCSQGEIGVGDADENKKGIWKRIVAPQRLLVASSAAIGGPATAAALAKTFEWRSLLTPSLVVGNIGYALATFVALLFYRFYR